MTCIVAVIDGRNIIMGGDSAAVDASLEVRTRQDEKVFVRDGYTIGFTSSFRMGQIIHHVADLPRAPTRGDPNAFMCSRFIPAVMQAFDTNGYGGAAEDGKRGGTFIVGFMGQLFEVHEDFQVCHIAEDYTAIGSGSSIALGSLYSTRGWKDPLKRVREALEAATHFNAGVRPPYLIVGDR